MFRVNEQEQKLLRDKTERKRERGGKGRKRVTEGRQGTRRERERWEMEKAKSWEIKNEETRVKAVYRKISLEESSSCEGRWIRKRRSTFCVLSTNSPLSSPFPPLSTSFSLSLSPCMYTNSPNIFLTCSTMPFQQNPVSHVDWNSSTCPFIHVCICANGGNPWYY